MSNSSQSRYSHVSSHLSLLQRSVKETMQPAWAQWSWMVVESSSCPSMPMPLPCTEQQQHQLSHDLQCAVCGCHRNFHRKHVEMHYQEQVPVLQCVVPPPVVVRGAFGTDVQDSSSEETELVALGQPKKRFRTKFSAEQKAKMFDFAEHMGWRVQRSDDSMVRQFCAQVGVKRRVFKVWIHNQKQAMKKKQQS
ncbi:hypothetical protein Syun_005065 [Stephania yunnanensis]|uniref:ZF-HD dimerization-type domain-containing protein n=1 Tax=Stephania yunnanensis TaxID=152371 RepID=A0AAP0L5K6_9MAGN